MEVVEHKKFICTDARTNHNKVWQYAIHDNGDVLIEWGRVGKALQMATYNTGTTQKAQALVAKKVKQKIKKRGSTEYREVSLLTTTTNGNGHQATAASLREIAKSQIEHSCPLVGDLIDYLVQVNRHNIYKASGGKISWNKDANLFQTPVGIVTLDNVTRARPLLAVLGDCVIRQDWTSDLLLDTLEKYLELIPQDIGMKFLPKRILPDADAIQKQNDVLDALESSYNAVVSGNVPNAVLSQPEPPTKVFDVRLQRVEDQTVLSTISRLYNDTRRTMHRDAYKLQPVRVFVVDIPTMKTNFADTAKRVGNIMPLWHGTRASNLLSILKSGLVIPPANAGHCTGRMFGNGVYFSDQSTKALNYSVGYWSGGSCDQRTFMFLADVSMGKTYTPRSSSERLPKPGYDSTFAKANYSGVLNNEMIVYDLSQCCLRFLVEFA